MDDDGEGQMATPAVLAKASTQHVQITVVLHNCLLDLALELVTRLLQTAVEPKKSILARTILRKFATGDDLAAA